MLMIRPKAITAAALTSNVAETTPAGWDAAVTYGVNDQVAVLASAVITNHANTTVTSLGGGVYTVEKTSGTTSTYNASATASAAATGDFSLRLAQITASGLFVGVSTVPLADDSTGSINYAWQFFGTWAVCEGGASIVPGLASSTYAWIWRSGTTLGYGRGATLAVAQAAPDRTVSGVTSTLYFDSSLYNSNEKVEALFSYVSTGATPVPLYRSLQAANLNHDPASSPTWWAANGFVYPSLSPTTIYALANIVTDTTGHRLYESLSGGSSATVTMTIASPCVVSWTAHWLVANTPITFTTTGALPTGLTAGTLYYVLAPTTNSFNVSATAGGSAINTSGSQSGTHTAIANPNLNKAITDPTFWLDIGPSNKWAMFDSYNGTATTDATLIDVTMGLTGRADSLALLSLASAVSVRVVVSTVADGTLYDMTRQLTSTDGISSWYSWFFEEIERKSNLLLTDLPSNLNPTVRVILTGTGTSTMECGNLVVGQQKDLGRTLHDGAQVGIIDYSRKDIDEFGNATIIQRAFSKRGSFRMRIAKAQVDGVQTTLSDFRATPAVYAATSDYGSTLIFGFFRSFDIAIDYPLESLVSIEIEGLT